MSGRDDTIRGGEGPFDIKPISIADEMKRSYLDYAMSVIVSACTDWISREFPARCRTFATVSSPCIGAFSSP